MKGNGDWRARLMDHIRESGGRVTRPRMQVAEVFFGMKGHPGVEELAAEVHRRHRGIGYANRVPGDEAAGRVRAVAAHEFGEGFARYEAQAPQEHHDHLICTTCGRILEFEDPMIEDLQQRVSASHGFRMKRHRLDIYGTCAACTDRPTPRS